MEALLRLWRRLKARGLAGVWLGLAALLLALGCAAGAGLAQEAGASAAAPVTLDGQTLFYIDVGAGGYTPALRAQAVSDRIGRFARGTIPLAALEVVDNPLTETSDITTGRAVLVSFSDADGRALDVRRQVLAQRTRRIIAAAVEAFRAERHPRQIALDVLYALLALLGLGLSIRLVNGAAGLTARRLRGWQGSRIGALRLFGSEVLPPDRVVDGLCEGLRLARLALLVLLLGGFASLVLSFFPWTQNMGMRLFGYGYGAARVLWQGFVAYLPNLFFIALIALVTAYILRILKFFFTEIRRGRLGLPGFHPQWAQPTFVIVRLLVLFFAATVVYPYLPGSETPAFQGISIFVGALFTLGSSGAIANLIAGVVLVYNRGYEVGDRVQISDATGDVLEKTLFVTRIRTVKNVVVTVPNALVLGSHIINYTTSSGGDKVLAPLILHTPITLGYDTPWRKVHQTLIEAAKATKNVLNHPEPFVLQTALNDFYVSYELNAYTDKPKLMARTYSELHQNIQDHCFAAGIEILSPHYRAVRDGNTLAVPAEHYPKGYQAPGFRVVAAPLEEKGAAKEGPESNGNPIAPGASLPTAPPGADL